MGNGFELLGSHGRWGEIQPREENERRVRKRAINLNDLRGGSRGVRRRSGAVGEGIVSDSLSVRMKPVRATEKKKAEGSTVGTPFYRRLYSLNEYAIELGFAGRKEQGGVRAIEEEEGGPSLTYSP